MINFVVVSSDLRPYVLDTLVKRGAELLIDHHLVVSWIRKATGQTWETQTRSEGELGTPDSVCRGFNSHLWKNFPLILGNVRNVESEWAMLKTSIV